MNSSGFYYAPCPYCGQSSEKRGPRGGCVACGGRYPGGEQYENERYYSPNEGGMQINNPYFRDGGVSMITGRICDVLYDPGRSAREAMKAIEDAVEADKGNLEITFDRTMRLWFGE